MLKENYYKYKEDINKNYMTMKNLNNKQQLITLNLKMVKLCTLKHFQSYLKSICKKQQEIYLIIKIKQEKDFIKDQQKNM